MTQLSPTLVDMGAQAAGLMRAQTRGTQALIRVEARDIKRVEGAAIIEAQLLGYSALYGWGSGKDRIEGPAWPLTKSLMRVYGNCSLDMDPVQDLPDAWVFTARAVDMETGYSISRQFRQSKAWMVYGKHDDARKEDVRFQIGQSKALRNVALAFLPDWLVDRAMDAAKGGMRERIVALIDDQAKAIRKANPDADDAGVADEAQARVVKAAFAKLASMGITEERGLYTIGRKNLASVTIEDLVVIRGGIAAVEKGTDSADEVFPTPKVTDAAPGVKDDLLTRIKGKNEPKPEAPTPGPQATPERTIDRSETQVPNEPAAPQPPAKAKPADDPSDPLAGAAANPDAPKPTTAGAGGSMFPGMDDKVVAFVSGPTTVGRSAKLRVKAPKHPVP